MEKFSVCFVLCVLFNDVFAMAYARRIAGVTEEEVAAAIELRKNLTTAEQDELEAELESVLAFGGPRYSAFDFEEEGRRRYADLKSLLKRGVNPNGCRHYRPLNDIMSRFELCALLISYGADPTLKSYTQHPSTVYDIIAAQRTPEIVQLMVRTGGNINALHLYKTGSFQHKQNPLYNTCRDGGEDHEYLVGVAWLLTHGANPNICSPFRLVLDHDYGMSLQKAIALFQYGATISHDMLTMARQSRYQTAVENLALALSEHKLDPQHVYKISEYKAMGISHENAELIQKATQEVNEAFAQCRLDDWQFEHPGQSLSKFILTRELGKAGNRRK